MPCSALLSLSCEQASELTATLGCDSICDGCCTVYAPSPPPPEQPHAGDANVAYVALGVIGTFALLFAGYSVAAKRSADEQQRRSSLKMIELPVVSDQGEARGARRVKVEEYLRDEVAKAHAALPPDGPGTSGSSKFSCDSRELSFGRPKDAALGISYFMQVSDDDVRSGMNQGVAAIEGELEASGSEEAIECLRYVLYKCAGSSKKIFENSPYPRDCDADGLRADRKTQAGEGMKLDDFVAHPHSRAANLSRAHVLALRLYTTAACAPTTSNVMHGFNSSTQLLNLVWNTYFNQPNSHILSR